MHDGAMIAKVIAPLLLPSRPAPCRSARSIMGS